MIYHVLQHPDPATLARVAQYPANEPALPDGWVRMTPEEFAAWQHAEIAVGWVSTPPEPVSVVPDAVTARQIRLELLARGVSLAAIDAMLPDDAARVEWEYATVIERSHPLVAAMAAALQLSVDDVFTSAADR